MLSWLKSIIGGQRRKAMPADVPSEADFQTAQDCLDRMVKPAIFGTLGGGAAPAGRIASMWGGDFFGDVGETVPVSSGTGRAMRPLVQIRMDELSEVPACFSGLALLTLWVDVKAVFADDDGAGTGFVIRTYATLDDLVPIGPVTPGSKTLPVLPITWRALVLEQPHWDDIVSQIPASIAESDEEAWFFDSRYAAVTEPLCETCPVKLGGWPNWIQNSVWPADGEFYFQVDATDKGKFSLGDGGSMYLFRTPRGWVSRADCY